MMNHTIHKPLFGKQESQESIQESWNQAKNLKIPESRRRKFRVADPSTACMFSVFHYIPLCMGLSKYFEAVLKSSLPWMSPNGKSEDVKEVMHKM